MRFVVLKPPSSTFTDQHAKVAEKQARAGEQKFNLPEIIPELRNRIYDFILVKPGGIEVKSLFSRDRSAKADRSKTNFLRTCRQIHSEAAPIYCGRNNFYCPKGIIGAWLKNIGCENRALLHKIRLCAVELILSEIHDAGIRLERLTNELRHISCKGIVAPVLALRIHFKGQWYNFYELKAFIARTEKKPIESSR